MLLAVNAHGAGRSLAATVHGFTHFEPRLRLAGVIANQSGPTGHGALLAESLRAAGLPPLVGAVPRDALPKLENRHLGLVAADQSGITPAIIDELADALEQYVDLDADHRTGCRIPLPSGRGAGGEGKRRQTPDRGQRALVMGDVLSGLPAH